MTTGKNFFPDLNLPLVYSDTPVVPDSRSDYYALVCADKGFLTIGDTGGIQRFPAPAAVFIRPGHSIQNIDAHENRVQCCVFRPEAINTTIFKGSSTHSLSEISGYFFFNPFTNLPQSGYAVRPLLSSLVGSVAYLGKRLDENLNTRQGEFWPCMSRSYFLELLILLERGMQGDSLAAEQTSSPSGGPLEAVREYIYTKYADRLTLDSLASRFATNRTSLNRRFNETYGLSVMAYVNSVRIAVAASLLRNTELSISEIASRTGYADESYFARAFRKKYSVSPGAFRKSFPDPYS